MTAKRYPLSLDYNQFVALGRILYSYLKDNMNKTLFDDEAATVFYACQICELLTALDEDDMPVEMILQIMIIGEQYGKPLD